MWIRAQCLRHQVMSVCLDVLKALRSMLWQRSEARQERSRWAVGWKSRVPCCVQHLVRRPNRDFFGRGNVGFLQHSRKSRGDKSCQRCRGSHASASVHPHQVCHNAASGLSSNLIINDGGWDSGIHHHVCPSIARVLSGHAIVWTTACSHVR